MAIRWTDDAAGLADSGYGDHTNSAMADRVGSLYESGEFTFAIWLKASSTWAIATATPITTSYGTVSAAYFTLSMALSSDYFRFYLYHQDGTVDTYSGTFTDTAMQSWHC